MLNFSDGKCERVPVGRMVKDWLKILRDTRAEDDKAKLILDRLDREGKNTNHLIEQSSQENDDNEEIGPNVPENDLNSLQMAVKKKNGSSVHEIPLSEKPDCKNNDDRKLADKYQTGISQKSFSASKDNDLPCKIKALDISNSQKDQFVPTSGSVSSFGNAENKMNLTNFPASNDTGNKLPNLPPTQSLLTFASLDAKSAEFDPLKSLPNFGLRSSNNSEKPNLDFGLGKPNLDFGLGKPNLDFGLGKPNLDFGLGKPTLDFGLGVRISGNETTVLDTKLTKTGPETDKTKKGLTLSSLASSHLSQLENTAKSLNLLSLDGSAPLSGNNNSDTFNTDSAQKPSLLSLAKSHKEAGNASFGLPSLSVSSSKTPTSCEIEGVQGNSNLFKSDSNDFTQRLSTLPKIHAIHSKTEFPSVVSNCIPSLSSSNFKNFGTLPQTNTINIPGKACDSKSEESGSPSLASLAHSHRSQLNKEVNLASLGSPNSSPLGNKKLDSLAFGSPLCSNSCNSLENIMPGENNSSSESPLTFQTGLPIPRRKFELRRDSFNGFSSSSFNSPLNPLNPDHGPPSLTSSPFTNRTFNLKGEKSDEKEEKSDETLGIDLTLALKTSDQSSDYMDEFFDENNHMDDDVLDLEADYTDAPYEGTLHMKNPSSVFGKHIMSNISGFKRKLNCIEAFVSLPKNLEPFDFSTPPPVPKIKKYK